MSMNHDLFGDPIKEAPEQQELPPLTSEQIANAVHVLPDFLLDQLSNSVASLREEQLRLGIRKEDFVESGDILSTDSGKFKLTAARKRFLAEIFWVFELGPTYFPFEVACRLASKALDPEVIRNSISARYGDEIRLLYRLLLAHDKSAAKPMAKKLGHYVTLH